MAISERIKKTNIYNTIGNNIKHYRKLNNITQRELAEKALVSENLIAKLESITYQTISIDTLEIIAEVLNVEISKLLEK
ncbi:MAG: helix-turn-helix transcriptional regulator [Bacilli bacterium]